MTRRAAVLMRALVVAALVRSVVPSLAAAQADTTAADTTAARAAAMAQDGVYDRPFITSAAGTSIGGYVEGNTNWFVEDGIGDGLSMELRRFNVFLFSSISSRLRFLAELEFEHGAEEIALETALVDVQVRPSLTLRAGIILPPIGYLNQNHDSPRWDFVERPLATTEIIPSTLSEVGGGAYGKVPLGAGILSYDVYLTNGLGDGVIENDLGRTHIPAGKRAEQFADDNNGEPAVSARIGFRRPDLGELGVSWYGATYNSFRADGEEIDRPRRVDLLALDAGVAIGPMDARAELVWADVSVPAGMVEVFGTRQWGGHVDLVVPMWRPEVAGYEAAVLSAGVRLERVDFNSARFSSTGASIGDEITAIVPMLSFRPSPETVFRLNYRYAWITDFVGNEAVRSAGLQLGFATYF